MEAEESEVPHETTVKVYHRHFEDPDNPGERHETATDVGMGWDIATNKCNIDVQDPETFDEVYELAASFTTTGERLTEDDVYGGWEAGCWHDPTETRSMAVGDVIVINDRGYFVDKVGFVEIDVPADGSN